jgi:hypothetical protein
MVMVSNRVMQPSVGEILPLEALIALSWVMLLV